jgi:general secretion pathway protein F
MKYFVATVLTKGKKEQLPLYAKNKQQATDLAKLKNSGILIKVIETREPLEVQFQRFQKNFFQNIKKRKIKHDSLISAVRQLAVMTHAGISIHDSLKDISKSTDDETLKKIFNKLAEDIDAGHALSHSMKQFQYELSNLTIAMVELGEKTGRLDQSLSSLTDMLEEIRNNITKFKKAMNYPRNVLIAMVIAFSVLISYVVPKFKSIFEKLHSQLPMPTKILLWLEHIFNDYGSFLILFISLTFMTAKYFINHSEYIRTMWHKLLLNTYIINNIIKYSTLNRFTLVFSELLKAGIPMSEALNTATSMVDNLVVRAKLYSVRINVEKGTTLHKGLQDTKLFENMIITMISAGEESGALDTMMSNVTNYYKMRFDGVINNISSAIEPVMLIFISSLVLLLALGIFMPMWDMSNALHGR